VSTIQPPTPPSGGLRINIEHQAPIMPPQAPPPPARREADPAVNMMREMMQVMHAPAPPPAAPVHDPVLMQQFDSMKEMMEKIVEHQERVEKEHTIEKANATPCPPPPQAPPPTPIIVNVAPPQIDIPMLPPPPPPPPSIMSSTSSVTKEDIQTMISNFNSAPPIVTLPPQQQENKQIQELRELVLQQQKANPTVPIVLPAPQVYIPPAPESKADPMVLPPPPPSLPIAKEDIKSMLQEMHSVPARIPAPPVFNITQAGPVFVEPCVNCNPLPAPETKVTEPEEKCSRVEGSPLPRCKREPPKGVKCKRKEGSDVMKIVGESEDVMDEDDEECETDDIPIAVADKPKPDCPDCDKEGVIHPREFNPKKLLERLCAGGKCPQFADRQAVSNGLAVKPRGGPFPNGGWMRPNTGSV